MCISKGDVLDSPYAEARVGRGYLKSKGNPSCNVASQGITQSRNPHHR